jgi:hypothetical protein
MLPYKVGLNRASKTLYLPSPHSFYAPNGTCLEKPKTGNLDLCQRSKLWTRV